MMGLSSTDSEPDPTLDGRRGSDPDMQQQLQQQPQRADQLSRDQAEALSQNLADAMLESDEDEDGDDDTTYVKSKFQPVGTCVYFKRDDDDDDGVDLLGAELDSIASPSGDLRGPKSQSGHPAPTSSRSHQRVSMEKARDEAIVREVSRDLGCCAIGAGAGGRRGSSGSASAPAAGGVGAMGKAPRRRNDSDEDFCLIEGVGTC